MQKAYFFNNGKYLRFDIPSDKVDIGPTPVNKDSWKGFPANWTKVGAAVNWGNGKIYMFNGGSYIRFDILLDKVDQGEKPIAGNWDGFPLPWLKVDAAVNWGNGKVYMFNGGNYIRYDVLQDKVDQAERPIHGNWQGFPDDWKKVDAVLNWGDGSVYMFNGDKYIRFSVVADKVDQGVRPIKGNWKGFPGDWKKIDDGVIIDKTAEEMGFKIEQSIKSKAVGFAYVIYDNKRLVKSGYGGLRVKVPEPYLFKSIPFSINTQMGIGSITKSLTSMAMLKCLYDKNDKKINVDQVIAGYLPKTWLQGPNISTITFRQLLTHTSGMLPNNPDDDHGTLKFIVMAGIGATGPYKEEYSNANFSLMRILIPSVSGLPLSDPQTVAEAYKYYMQKRVFEPGGVHNAECRLNSEEYALLYGPPSDTSGAYPYDGDEDSTLIAGAGGWKLSALELAKVINTFFTTERILPKLIRDQMIDETLGCYKEPDSICVTATHNGAWNSNGKGYHNCYYIFNDGVQCVLMTNSFYPKNPFSPLAGMDPETAVKAAHKASFGCNP